MYGSRQEGTEPVGRGPLAGIRVLDFTQNQAGPMAPMLLADYGADILKVEPPGVGDPIRTVQGRDGFSSQLFAFNRGKRSIQVRARAQPACSGAPRGSRRHMICTRGWRAPRQLPRRLAGLHGAPRATRHVPRQRRPPCSATRRTSSLEPHAPVRQPRRGAALRGPSAPPLLRSSAPPLLGASPHRLCRAAQPPTPRQVDLKTAAGRDVILRLAKTVDVVLENFKLGVLEKLGIGYDVLKKLNPALIYVSASGFGQRGPWANRGSYDSIAQAFSGAAVSQGGGPSHRPIRVGTGNVSDTMSGIMAAFATLAALLARERLGVSQRVDSSQLGAMLILLNLSIRQFLHYRRQLDDGVMSGPRGCAPYGCPKPS